MNLDNVIDIKPRKKIGFISQNQEAKVFNIENYLEKLVKNIIKKEMSSEISKYRKELCFFIDAYKENAYSQFGYALFILTQPEYSQENFKYNMALAHINNGLELDENNLHGIELGIRVHSYLIIEDEKYLKGAEEFVKEYLEVYPDNQELKKYLEELRGI